MTEALMIFALGFLLATLLALVAAQFIWRRAVASTTKRLTEEGAVREPAPAPQPAAHNGVETAALQEEAHNAREEAAAQRAEAARLARALEEAQGQARRAEAALSENRNALAAREAEVTRLEAKLRTIKDAAADTAREAASTLSRSQHLSALLADEPAPAPQARESLPATSIAAIVPAAETGTAPAERAPETEGPRTPEELEDVRADLLSFSEDIRAAFGQAEEELDDEDAESDSALQRKNLGEIRPSQTFADRSLEDRIRALQDGAPSA
ncbi:hypothetical protein ACSHT0_06465 [Tepidicaulis sp. LMO-SS28]|uniref:hypothetical protein n=1 Tax=Tepidicaulis sp. LMO-SS28 TaxID=3447455 RepID=UPI003EE2790D